MSTKDEGPGSDAGPLEEAEPAAENPWSELVSISLCEDNFSGNIKLQSTPKMKLFTCETRKERVCVFLITNATVLCTITRNNN